ncbi:MAG: WG repeat-containing protein [Lachnospiraceae bacterium]
MKCLKCGMENSAEAKFCKNCGQQLIRKEKKKNKVILGICGLVVLAAIVIGIYVVPRNSSKSEAAKEQYENYTAQGNKYFDEMEYEQAEAEYLKAIEIEPKQEEPYVLLADLYVAWMKPEKSKEIIEQGMQNVPEEQQVKLPEKLREVENYIEFTWVVEPTIEADDIYYVKRDGADTTVSYNELQQQFMQEYAAIRRGDALGLIGMDGKVLGDLDYKEIRIIFSSYLLERSEEKYETQFESDWGIYTLYEGEIVPTVFGDGGIQNVYYYYEEQMINVMDQYEHGYLEALKVPIPIQSSDYLCTWEDWYQIDGAYAIYSDKQLATDFIYEQCGSYSEGLLAVMKDGKWGYVDGQGEVVIPLEYDATWEQYEETYESGQIDYCYAATEGFLILRQEGKWELCDLAGNVVIPSGCFEAIRPVYEGKCWVKKDGKWGVIKVAEATEAAEEIGAEETTDADESAEAAKSDEENAKYYHGDLVELTGEVQIFYDEELDNTYVLLKLDTSADFEVYNMEGAKQEYKNCEDIQVFEDPDNWRSYDGKKVKVKGSVSSSAGTNNYCRSYVLDQISDIEVLE